jgi:2,3-bisphosphoglycerate-independent phosphoglycerate mutase
MGASEPGHYILGAGRVVLQPLEELNQSFKTQEILTKKAFQEFLAKAKSRKVHLLGMVSDGGVHSDIRHLNQLAKIFQSQGIADVYLQAIADGRDVPERSIASYLSEIDPSLQLSSLIGRYYAMDRDQNYDRTEIAYRLLTQGQGQKITKADLTKNIYRQADTDYYLKPLLFPQFTPIEEDDLVLFFNFRSDRAAQLTSAFTDPDFSEFQRDTYFAPKTDQFLIFGPYGFGNATNLYEPPTITNNLGSWWAQHNVKQLRIAETEKYAHVTFFFNSQQKEVNPGEDRILVLSPKVASYDAKPEMSAREVTAKAIEQIRANKYQAIVLNYANCDLVGHSGDLKATIKACEVVDECLSELIPAAQRHEFQIIITSDHGNSDQMLYPDGRARPAHSSNAVPCLFFTNKSLVDLSKRVKGQINSTDYHGELADIAPTLLDLMELPTPSEMTGESFIAN